MLRSKGAQSAQWAVAELTQYLDIFYTDVKGWVKLADMHVELNLCMQAFSVCTVLMPGQVHALTAGPAAAHSTGPVPHAVLREDGIHALSA